MLSKKLKFNVYTFIHKFDNKIQYNKYNNKIFKLKIIIIPLQKLVYQKQLNYPSIEYFYII